jgi:hypothetical protein
MSATGSVNLIVCFSFSHPFAPRLAENLQRLALQSFGSSLVVGLLTRRCERPTTSGQRRVYHEDFETPGISPSSASCRKHKRHMPNFRRNARGRPHRLHRLCLRVENLGFFASLTLFAVVAIQSFTET